mmetsp:Transcript_94779/g.283070  ORF Transcript_94779/g.283070 Transcript_94779/m.283070 type:complete len:207 (-) Transcript_94779:727-1347(-)
MPSVLEWLRLLRRLGELSGMWRHRACSEVSRLGPWLSEACPGGCPWGPQPGGRQPQGPSGSCSADNWQGWQLRRPASWHPTPPAAAPASWRPTPPAAAPAAAARSAAPARRSPGGADPVPCPPTTSAAGIWLHWRASRTRNWRSRRPETAAGSRCPLPAQGPPPAASTARRPAGASGARRARPPAPPARSDLSSSGQGRRVHRVPC